MAIFPNIRFIGGTGERPTYCGYAGGTNTDLGFFLEDDYFLGPFMLTGGVRADSWSIRDGLYAQPQRWPCGTINNRLRQH